MMKGNETDRTRWSAFVVLRRKWFGVVLVFSFLALLPVMNRHYNSALEIISFTTIGALILTTCISLLSAPVVWLLTRRERQKT